MVAIAPAPEKQETLAPLLHVRGVVADYGAHRALNGVDLEVRAGEIVALAGENGAGKSTVVRCIAGDLSPVRGDIDFDGERIRPRTGATARRGVAVVWQDLALCDNLDVASNLLLGAERRRFLLSDAKFHGQASQLLETLNIPIADTTRLASSLSGGQRQLLAVARAMRDRPRLLILDEPTASLGVIESVQVEALTRRLADEGTTILLVSHDIDQMFRLADRIAVLRQGRIVADVDTASGHPDEVIAFMSGQPVDSSPRRQLDRLHSLVGRLTSADPSSSLAVILSALGTALAADRLCIHLVEDTTLRMAAAVGLPNELIRAWRELPLSTAGGPAGVAAVRAQTMHDVDVRYSEAWAGYLQIAEQAGIRSSWTVPVIGSSGLLGVITVFRGLRGSPHRDELDLVTLYAGYAASAAERDGLLNQVTARNRVLETIRVVLEQLSGSFPVSEGLDTAIDTLRLGLRAEEVGLVEIDDGRFKFRSWSGIEGGRVAPTSPLLAAAARLPRSGNRRPVVDIPLPGWWVVAADIRLSDDSLILLAAWRNPPGSLTPSPSDAATSLIEDAARSFQLALEREGAEGAQREAAAARRSQELQLDFLSRLSHELRTPLTAIHGYADSLLQTDVTWDAETKTRFLSRITSESARLSRLVGDLLDLSAVDSNLLRLQRDWCDLPLVVDAAVACLPLDVIDRVTVRFEPMPMVFADHDRVEQVLVNLMDNAIRHNPAGTVIDVTVAQPNSEEVTITVADDGIGLPHGATGLLQGDYARTPTSGAGLGLSISRAIVDAHGGRLDLDHPVKGTSWRVTLPIAAPQSDPESIRAAPAIAEGHDD